MMHTGGGMKYILLVPAYAPPVRAAHSITLTLPWQKRSRAGLEPTPVT